MTNVTGTATNAEDLYAKLRAFLKTDATLVATGQQWTEVWDNGGGATGEFVLRGPGASGSDQIYVGFRLNQSVTEDSYYCSLRGMTGVLPASPSVEDHINVQPYESIFFLDAAPMTYWFIANGRRFIVIVKITTIYEMAYAGFILPYGLPNEYPYPLMVGGSACRATSGATTPKQWRDYVQYHSGFPWPVYSEPNYINLGYPSQYILDPSGNWLALGNTGASVAQVTVGPGYTKGDFSTGGDTDYYQYSKLQVYSRMTNAYGGNRAAVPITLYHTANASQTFGVLDGVLKCQGHLMGAEDQITINGVNHLVVQNVFRTDLFDYVAMELA
jgi:hypothetical protein